MTRQADQEEINALRQEQRDEVEGTMIGPGNVGPYTKGANQGLVKWIPAGIILGAIVGAILGFALDAVAVGIIVGVVAGGTIGLTAGPFVGSRQRGEGDARHDDPSVTQRKTAPNPVRLDEGQADPPAAPSEGAEKLLRE